jgi:hypothetical protein
MFLLSRAEKEYLEEKLEKNYRKNGSGPKRSKQEWLNYRRNVKYKIRRKLRKTMNDLRIVFEKSNATDLRFYSEDWSNLALPLMKAIQLFYYREHFFEEMQKVHLMAALDLAGKRYDYKRLITNGKYKQRMIDWLVKNGMGFWNPPTTEEQNRRFEEMKRMLGKPETAMP